MPSWKTFNEAVAEVHGSKTLRIVINANGPVHVPSPPWDPRAHHADLVQGKPEILVLDQVQGWISASLHPPAQLLLPPSALPSLEFRTKTRNILFMDVTGWSQLKAAQIHDYVVKAMPKIAARLLKNDFLNTWGDAVVATFESAKDAAEAALELRDVFRKGYAHEGIPPGLSCRISLHVGEAIVGFNALTQHEDIFGHDVHLAARLEPVTTPGHVFCTRDFAERLRAVDGSAPRAWPLGPIELPKGFGSVEAAVVTWPGDPDPGLKVERADKQAKPEAASNELGLRELMKAWPIDLALRIDLLPSDDPLAVVNGRHTDVAALFRVTNLAPFPITTRAIHLRWQLTGSNDGLTAEFECKGEQPVEHEHRLIAPGGTQDIKVKILADLPDVPAPRLLRFGTTGDILASSEPWDGNQRRNLAAFVWGYVVDTRKGES